MSEWIHVTSPEAHITASPHVPTEIYSVAWKLETVVQSLGNEPMNITTLISGLLYMCNMVYMKSLY